MLLPQLTNDDCAENQQYTDADNLKNITDPQAFYSVLGPADDPVEEADGAQKDSSVN